MSEKNNNKKNIYILFYKKIVGVGGGAIGISLKALFVSLQSL